MSEEVRLLRQARVALWFLAGVVGLFTSLGILGFVGSSLFVAMAPSPPEIPQGLEFGWFLLLMSFIQLVLLGVQGSLGVLLAMQATAITKLDQGGGLPAFAALLRTQRNFWGAFIVLGSLSAVAYLGSWIFTGLMMQAVFNDVATHI